MPVGDPEAQELQRAAVMFPRLFLWVIGALLTVMMGLGSFIVADLRSDAAEKKQKIEKHEQGMGEHEARLRLLEQSQKDLKDTAKETNQDVKRLLELQLRQQNGRRDPPRATP